VDPKRANCFARVRTRSHGACAKHSEWPSKNARQIWSLANKYVRNSGTSPLGSDLDRGISAFERRVLFLDSKRANCFARVRLVTQGYSHFSNSFQS